MILSTYTPFVDSVVKVAWAYYEPTYVDQSCSYMHIIWVAF